MNLDLRVGFGPQGGFIRGDAESLMALRDGITDALSKAERLGLKVSVYNVNEDTSGQGVCVIVTSPEFQSSNTSTTSTTNKRRAA